MITITKPSAHRVDIDIHGALDADAMERGLDRLIAESEGVRNGRMLYTIDDFTMPTMGALAVEFSRLPKLFGLLGKFDRCAVLSDAGWIRNVAELEGALFPGLTIKSFPLSQKEAAEDWLKQGSDAESEMDPTENVPV